jgi:rod shape-determining protein MreC
MQKLVQFIIKNSTGILFILIAIVCFSFIFKNNPFHRSKFLSASNSFTGSFHEKMEDINRYFSLESELNQLKDENLILKKELFKNNINSINSQEVTSYKGFEIIQGRIIKNSYNTYENFLTINAGSNKNVKPEMGVMNSLGIIGVVEFTSKNYASVISILNRKSMVNAKLKNSEHFGWITWNGKSTGFVQLVDMPRLATVKQGDTIVTGTQGIFFPENQNIGTVHKIYTDGETNYFTIDVKLFNDMTNLKNVFVIKNRDKKEIEMLEKQDSIQSSLN